MKTITHGMRLGASSAKVLAMGACLLLPVLPLACGATDGSEGGVVQGEHIASTAEALNPSSDPTLILAGDIAGYNGQMAATGSLVKTLLGQNASNSYVAVLGDITYGGSDASQGCYTDFTGYYAPNWGLSALGSISASRVFPTPGNHDYGNCDLGTCSLGYGCTATGNTATNNGKDRVMDGYVKYYQGQGIRVSDTTASATTLHYGVDLVTSTGAKWRYISLDSGFCFYAAGNCASGSSEYSWLSSELSNHQKGTNGYVGIVVGTHINQSDGAACNSWANTGGRANNAMGPMVSLMYKYRVDAYVAGHTHAYERYCGIGPSLGSASQNNCGTGSGPVCTAGGPVEINVGVGGFGAFSTGDAWANALQHADTRPGVVRLTLKATWWQSDYFATNTGATASQDSATHGLN